MYANTVIKKLHIDTAAFSVLNVTFLCIFWQHPTQCYFF